MTEFSENDVFIELLPHEFNARSLHSTIGVALQEDFGRTLRDDGETMEFIDQLLEKLRSETEPEVESAILDETTLERIAEEYGIAVN